MLYEFGVKFSFYGAGVGELLDDPVLLLQGLCLDILLVAVLHPLDAVHVPEEGVPLLVVVAGVGGGGGVARGGGVHVDVVGQQTLEHGAGLARLHVEHQLGELLVLVHLLDGLGQVRGFEVVLSKRHQALTVLSDWFFSE